MSSKSRASASEDNNVSTGNLLGDDMIDEIPETADLLGS
jgi:hypothetical protein